jgi:hypothetical protein
LVILLFIWVVLVMLLPNMSPYVARHIWKVGDKAVVDTKCEALEKEFGNVLHSGKYVKKLQETGNYPPDLLRFMKGQIRHMVTPYPRIAHCIYAGQPRCFRAAEIPSWEVIGALLASGNCPQCEGTAP